MDINEFFSDRYWDFPFYKILANNDTGGASGHQGGLVIPQELRQYFPSLTGATTPENPTIDYFIKAMLFVDGEYRETVITRYQIQSWGATRSPESRLTSNLTSLRNVATADDILIIQRNLEKLDFYRLFLLTHSNSVYNEVRQSLDNRWGLFTSDCPVTQMDMTESAEEERLVEIEAFKLFEESKIIGVSRSRRIARSLVFKKTIQKIYTEACCVCGTGLRSPNGPVEVEAAHIVPKSRSGSDDARNGLSLCKRHHWAFDQGLFGISGDRKIRVPSKVLSIAQNSILSDINGQSLITPSELGLEPNPEALKWHYENISFCA